MQPLVSTVIPCYNGEKYISEALNSVGSQSYDNIEIIVVNDNSTDCSAQLVENHPVDTTIVNHEVNKGIAQARNTGIKEANGEYIALLDQDDIWKPYRIEKMVTYLEKNPEIGLAISNYDFIDRSGQKVGERRFKYDYENWSSERIAKYMIYDIWRSTEDNPPVTSDFIRSGVFESVGLYNDEFVGHNDQEFLLRVSKEYDIKVFSSPLMCKRVHAENESSKKSNMLEDQREFFKRVLQDYPQMQHYESEINSYLYMREAKLQLEKGNFQQSLSQILKSIRYDIGTSSWLIYKYLKEPRPPIGS